MPNDLLCNLRLVCALNRPPHFSANVQLDAMFMQQVVVLSLWIDLTHWSFLYIAALADFVVIRP